MRILSLKAEQQKINFEKQQSQIGETSAPYVHDQKDKNHDVESFCGMRILSLKASLILVTIRS
jgi:hypothetical protein